LSERRESKGRDKIINMSYFVYFARCPDNSLYIGCTDDPNQRIERHNRGEGSHWIRQHGSAKIVYLEEYDTLIEARRRELQVKRWSRIKKENLIKHGHPNPEKVRDKKPWRDG